MAYKKQHREAGIDTTQTIGGFLSAGWHNVTIMEARDMRETVVLLLENTFHDKITDRIFVTGLDDKNYSKKMTDLLSLMPESVIKDVVDNDYFEGLKGKEVRVRVQRTEGNYIEQLNGGFVVRGVGPEVYPTYAEAKAMLEQVGNKAYLRVAEYSDTEISEVKGVW